MAFDAEGFISRGENRGEAIDSALRGRADGSATAFVEADLLQADHDTFRPRGDGDETLFDLRFQRFDQVLLDIMERRSGNGANKAFHGLHETAEVTGAFGVFNDLHLGKR